MLSQARAERLARRATRDRDGGGQGWRERRAWRRLARTADGGDQNAIAAAWVAWLRTDHDSPQPPGPGQATVAAEKLVAALTRWGLPDHLLDTVFAALGEPDRSEESRAEVATLCARLARPPADPTRQAVFSVLTRQPGQHRAADPDGALLAAGYQAAGEEVRSAIRRTIADAGDLDLVHVLAGASQQGRTGFLTADEARLLTAALAAQDWPDVWQLVPDLPLLDAIATVRAIGDEWRPQAETGDQELFSLLARADTPAIEAAGKALAAPPYVSLDYCDARECFFSLNGRYLAVTETGPEPRWLLFELPDGRKVSSFDVPRSGPRSVVTAGGRLYGLDPLWDPGILVAFATGFPMRRMHQDLYPMSIWPWRSGFVLAAWTGSKLNQGHRVLAFCDGNGQVSDITMLHPPGLYYDDDDPVRLVAVDQKDGHLALLADNRLSWLSPDGRHVVATSPRLDPGEEIWVYGCFYGSSHLVTAGSRGVRLWRRHDDQLTAEATAEALKAAGPIAAFPARGEIAVGTSSGIRYLDGRDLAPISKSRFGRPGRVWASPNGRSFVISDSYGYRYVPDAHPARVIALADTPLGELTHADLAAVTAALSYDGPPAARPFLELLRDCLTLRFGGGAATEGP